MPTILGRSRNSRRCVEGMRSVRETVWVVRNIVARRKSGANIDWIGPYPWNWQQGVVYERGKGGQASPPPMH